MTDGGGSSREGRAEGISNVWIFLQEKRSCRMMSSPVTSSASCSCFVRDTTQVCETQGWTMTPRSKCSEASGDRSLLVPNVLRPWSQQTDLEHHSDARVL